LFGYREYYFNSNLKRNGEQMKRSQDFLTKKIKEFSQGARSSMRYKRMMRFPQWRQEQIDHEISIFIAYGRIE
jgi:hypothetical protein